MSTDTLKRQTVGGDNIPVVSGFSVAVDINSNVFGIYFLIWSLSRLLCCVGSGSNVAVAIDRAATGIGKLQYSSLCNTLTTSRTAG